MLRDERMAALPKCCMCRAAPPLGRLPPSTSKMPQLRAAENRHRLRSAGQKPLVRIGWSNTVAYDRFKLLSKYIESS